MWSDLQLAFAATLKLKEDTALVKTTCHFTFQTFTFHSYQKSEFRNVLEIAVKSAVKVTNAALRHRIKYPALAETSFNCLSLLKVLTLSNNRRAEGSSSPHNITIHGGLVGQRITRALKNHLPAQMFSAIIPRVSLFWQTAILILQLMRRYGEVLHLMRRSRSNFQNGANVQPTGLMLMDPNYLAKTCIIINIIIAHSWI